MKDGLKAELLEETHEGGLILQHKSSNLDIDVIFFSRLHLQLAVENEDYPKLQNLILGGADIDKNEYKGMTCLTHAAATGHVEGIEVLLLYSADVDVKSQEGQTPLMSAAAAGHHDCIRTLLKHNAKLDLVDVMGRTALAIALQNNRHQCAALLGGT